MTFLPCDIPRELLGTKADPTKLTLPCSPDITPDIKARMKAELEENETAVTVIVEVDRSELARWACPVYIDIQMALNDTVLAEVEILDDMRPGCDRFQAPQGIDMHFGRLGGVLDFSWTGCYGYENCSQKRRYQGHPARPAKRSTGSTQSFVRPSSSASTVN